MTRPADSGSNSWPSSAADIRSLGDARDQIAAA
jgi:hypothetical protein